MKLKFLLAVPLSIVPFLSAYATDSGQWELNVGTFYGQGLGQTLPSGVYGTVDPSSNSSSGIWKTGSDQFNPKYNLGYQIGIGYLFNSSQDLQLGWTHFNSDTTGTASHAGETLSNGQWGTQFQTMAGQTVYLFNGDYINENTKNTFKYDAIDATLGQKFAIGPRFQARAFAGIRGAQINSDINTTYNAIVNNGQAFNEVDNFKSSMQGIGPQVGMTSKFNIFSCLGLTSHVAVMGLVGQSKTNYTVNQNFSDGQVIVKGSTDFDGQTKVIPGYDLKMGLSCGIPLEGASIDLEAGYGITKYVNGLSQVDKREGINPSIISTDATISGPYFRLNYKF
jgi:Legionella pneumophila major outer membrane protein precursor